jgi:pimeloyl-ACP methyl ester carboxylesterase
MKNGTITTIDGRTVGFADYGTPGQTAVVWCHGGPGNRLEPAFVADSASRAGMRLIGIDRPGYGRSTPQPGRTIGGWVPDAIAIVDHLGLLTEWRATSTIGSRTRTAGEASTSGTSPVRSVLHGSSDGLAPVGNAHHTAAIVPGATLRIVENIGHLSILTEVVETTRELLARCTVTR